MKFPWATLGFVLLAAGSPRYLAQQDRSLEGVVLEYGTERPLEGVTVSASATGTQVSGIAYRNAEFMKKYEETGKAIRIEKGSRAVTEVTAVE